MHSEAADFEIIRLGALQDRLVTCSNRAELFGDGEFKSAVHEIFDAELENPETVFSLDVFDTLLLRDNSSELHRFYEIGSKMSELYAAGQKRTPFAPVDAFFARHLGTKATYRASRKVMGAREGSLSEIHLTASRLLRLEDKWAERFVECEIEYEATTITPNFFLLDYIRSFKQRGGLVILLSDMYFHADHIRILLQKLNVDDHLFDFIYSSGDEKISKASGLIFAKVAHDLKRRSFFHVGDSFNGDYIKPRNAGWNALHLPISAADLAARRASHDEALKRLNDHYAVTVDVARP